MEPITLVTEWGAVTTNDPAGMMLDYIETQQNHIPDDLYIPTPPSQTRKHHKANSTQPQRPEPILQQSPSDRLVVTQSELYNKLATILAQLALPPTQGQSHPAEEPQPQRQPRPPRAQESEAEEARADTPQIPASFSTSRYTGQRGSHDIDHS